MGLQKATCKQVRRERVKSKKKKKNQGNFRYVVSRLTRAIAKRQKKKKKGSQVLSWDGHKEGVSKLLKNEAPFTRMGRGQFPICLHVPENPGEKKRKDAITKN